jgi:cytochrome b561
MKESTMSKDEIRERGTEVVVLPQHYDRRTILLHWLTAFFVVALWTIGQTVDWFPKGNPRVIARSTHIGLGVFLVLIIVQRIWWRLRSGTRLPAADQSRWLRLLSRLTHRTLYLMICVTVVLGILNAWIRGDDFFGLFTIPSLSPNRELRDRIENLHALSANVLLAVAGFHALAGLLHHFIWRDGLLARMTLPRHRSGDADLPS